jgi:hypothetical protein
VNAQQFVILADGIVIGADACLLVHFGGRIWDDFQDRRAVRRATAKADAAEARVDALVGEERQ